MKKLLLPLALLCSTAMAELPLKVRADQALGQLQEKLKVNDFVGAYPWLEKVVALEKEGYKLPSAMGYFAGQVYVKNGFREKAKFYLESYISNEKGKYFWEAVVLLSDVSPSKGAAFLEKYLSQDPQPVHYQEAIELYSRIEKWAAEENELIEQNKALLERLSSKMGVLKDERDGKEYKTIWINGQNWMMENLEFAGVKVWCGKNEDTYNSYTLKQGYIWGRGVDFCARGYTNVYPEEVLEDICPTGWHLPKVVDFGKLIGRDWSYLLESKDPRDTDLAQLRRDGRNREYKLMESDSLNVREKVLSIYSKTHSVRICNDKCVTYKGTNEIGLSLNADRYWTGSVYKEPYAYVYRRNYVAYPRENSKQSVALFQWSSEFSYVQAAIRCIQD